MNSALRRKVVALSAYKNPANNNGIPKALKSKPNSQAEIITSTVEKENRKDIPVRSVGSANPIIRTGLG